VVCILRHIPYSFLESNPEEAADYKKKVQFPEPQKLQLLTTNQTKPLLISILPQLTPITSTFLNVNLLRGLQKHFYEHERINNSF
jgi:hypothetical protein